MSPDIGATLAPATGSLPATGSFARRRVENNRRVEKRSREYEVFFSKTGLRVKTDGGVTLLDLAEAHGVDIDYGCRGGGCGRCKVRCTKGEVFMTTEDGLEVHEKGAGFVLSCIGCPRSNTVISA